MTSKDFKNLDIFRIGIKFHVDACMKLWNSLNFSQEISFKKHHMTKTSNKEANTGMRSFICLGRKRSEIKNEEQLLKKSSWYWFHLRLIIEYLIWMLQRWSEGQTSMYSVNVEVVQNHLDSAFFCDLYKTLKWYLLYFH